MARMKAQEAARVAAAEAVQGLAALAAAAHPPVSEPQAESSTALAPAGTGTA